MYSKGSNVSLPHAGQISLIQVQTEILQQGSIDRMVRDQELLPQEYYLKKNLRGNNIYLHISILDPGA